MSRIAGRLVVGLIAAIALVLSSWSHVAAHAHPVSSVPAANATLPTPPRTVMIVFGELLDPAGSDIAVLNASGAAVSAGAAALVAGNPKALRVALQPNLGAGTYTVQWKSRSAEDGDPANGSYQFTVRAAVSAASVPSRASTAPSLMPQTGAAPLGSSGALAFLGALGLVGAGFALRRRSARPGSRAGAL